jgi:hypothetical protein
LKNDAIKRWITIKMKKKLKKGMRKVQKEKRVSAIDIKYQ